MFDGVNGMMIVKKNGMLDKNNNDKNVDDKDDNGRRAFTKKKLKNDHTVEKQQSIFNVVLLMP